MLCGVANVYKTLKQSVHTPGIMNLRTLAENAQNKAGGNQDGLL